jgi:molecular chaperone HtpG
MQKGNISVQSENIFPIIKKFLYSDQEIFLRELVSNAVDATSKLRTLVRKGEASADVDSARIEILLDKDAKTLTIRDAGIGMTAEEVERYLNQVAFSSAQEFIEKHKDDANIIGHFGLGFYSAFMVADKVEVLTKSYKNDGEPVKWTCTGNPEYTLETVDKQVRGTDVVLHVSEDAAEYLEEDRIDALLNKYCRFLPVEIQFGTRTETEGEGEDEKQVEVPNIINNTLPAWKKQPLELSDDAYKAFYKELYPFAAPPLFWIHLNIDYPFNLTGILYFPKLSTALEVQKNKIQLYSNQVYVTDDVSQIVPEFLTLLHGVIDSPDIPLNVSRSYLQSDKNVKKITGYITKKVSDKLLEMFQKDRENYEQKWKDIGTFVKYGMMTDEKFNEKAEKFLLLRSALDEKHYTLEEYKEKIKTNQSDKHNKIVCLYTNDTLAHDSFVQSAKEYGYDVLEMDTLIDAHFIQHLEYKDGSVLFVRVDSETADQLVQKDEKRESVLSEAEQKKVEGIFAPLVGKSGGQVVLKPLSPNDLPVVVTKPEFMRRMKEMSALQGGGFGGMDMGDHYNVVVNTNHPLIAEKLLAASDENGQAQLATHLYKLAMLSQGMLRGKDLTDFVSSSIDFLK